MNDPVKKTSWLQAHRPTTRRLVQLYSALLHNAYVKGFISGEIYKGNAKYACVPGFNCYSCPGAVGSCPLGSIQNALASTGHRAGWYVLGIILLFGVTLGRTICGWLCPLGLIQELLHKVPTFKIKKNAVTRALSWLKYVILAVFVAAIPLWYGLRYDLPLPGFCKYICPAGTFEGAVGHLANPGNVSMYSMLGILFTRKWVIMLVIVLACIFCYRSFCRFICPLGAIYGMFNRFNIIGVKVDTSLCNHCGACVNHCGMDVKCVGDHECINCGKCMDVCSQGAISMKAGSITLKAPGRGHGRGRAEEETALQTKTRRQGKIRWGIALAVLCFALLWFNVLDPAGRGSGTSASAQTSGGSPAAGSASGGSDGSGGENTPAVQTEAPDEETEEPDSETEAPVNETETSIDETEALVSEPETEAGKAEEETAEAAIEDSTEAAAVEAAPVENSIEAESGEAVSESSTEAAAGNASEEASGGDGPEAAAAGYDSDAPEGNLVGNRLPDFTLTCYDGSSFHLADKRGKITIINLWATYCTPCKGELPYFSDLYKEHEDSLAMIAVHPSLVTDDPEEYLADKGYAMPFATDTAENTVANIVGGGLALPQTIVLNRKGEVTYNQVGSITPEVLESLYNEADASAP